MENDSITVSIITPSYNQAGYLEQTIQSVLNQTYRNFEYIIIDGGSGDDSVDIIKKFRDRIAYWISEPDKGQADAINKGFRRAKGDLLCWVNSDDILYPDFLSRRVKEFRDNPDVDMIYGDIDRGTDLSVRRIRRGRKTDIKKMLKKAECPIPQQSAMWRREVLEKIGYLDPQWHVLLDREYFIRTAAKCSIKYIPGTVAFFRNQERSKSIMDKLKWAQELPRYYEMIFNDNIYQLPSGLLSGRNKCLSKIYMRCARIFERTGKQQQAREFYLKSKKASVSNYLLNRYLKRLF
jgi:glycosyltransferase involved in cell wall biosynthesis